MEDPTATIAAQAALITSMDRRITALERLVRRASPPVTREELSALQERVSEMRDCQNGQNDLLYGHDGYIGELQKDVDSLLEKTSGRNKSAPTKRSMSNEDAKECLVGQYKDLKHKEAGEVMGLTYAQVYSCRGEYTFKEVHAELRKSGWKNPWTKQ